MKIISLPILIGAPEAKPLVGIEEGAKVRLRMREDDFVTAFVRFSDRIEKWLVKDNGDGTWGLGILSAGNIFKPNTK